MTSIGAREHREQTGRDKTVDVLFKLEFSDGRYNFLNPTHEEVVTPIMKEFIKSHKDLPTSVFQIQTKFRNEKRAKSGILRGREFLMKDMYSFHATPDDLDEYYAQSINVYHQIFRELGIGEDTYLTYASGGTFSKYSHEFQTLTPLGEDVIYVDREKKLALNKEILDNPEVKTEFKDYHFEEARASEVGNIFKLATKFSAPFEVKYADKEGNLKEVYM
jgi:prolyl-tRNA synthetase